MSAAGEETHEAWLWGPFEPIAEYFVRRAPWLTFRQAMLLMTAAERVGLTPRHVAEYLDGAERSRAIHDLNVGGFEWVMDRFVVVGFRHPAVPMVTAVQLAALDEARRAAGLDGRTFVRGLREVMGLRSRHHLDGLGFAYAMEWLARLGSRVPLPGHGYMNRHRMRLVHEAVYEHGMSGATFREHLAGC